MIVIADTGPLNYLIQLGHDELLHTLYGRVIVPLGVLEEMGRPKAPSAVRHWASQPPAWIESVKVGSIDPSLHPELGLGEREAISLALTLGADLLLMDDRAARDEAEARRLSVTGTIAILIEGSLRGSCNLPVALSSLRLLGFRMSAALEASALERFRLRQQRSK
jgi:predicted nucleic acid-binding protein